MEVVCTQEHLRVGLETVERIAGRNPTLPVLKNVLMEGKEGRLFLTTTDLELALKTWIPAKVEKEGSLTLPARLLTTFIRQLPPQNIQIKEKQHVLLSCGEHEAVLQSADPKDFPLIPQPKKPHIVELPAEVFLGALGHVLPMVGQSEARPELNGIAFFFDTGSFTCVATDTFRLAEYNVQEKNVRIKGAYILPAHAAQEMVRIFKPQGTLTILLGESQAMVTQEETELTSRFITGEYPNYKEIIPKEVGTRVSLEREVLLQHLRIAGLFTGRLQNISINTNPEKGELTVHAKQEGIGEHRSTCLAKIQGEKMEIAFNFRYLIDGLQQMTDRILIELHGADKPAVIRPEQQIGFLYLVMPIKI